MQDVVCALIEHPHSGQFQRPLLLAARHGPQKQRPGRWEFPGGKREAGESLEQALHREIQEELQVKVEILEPLSPVCLQEQQLILHPFRCALQSGEPRSQEHDQLIWGSPIQLLRLRWLSADLNILREWLRVSI